MCFPAGQLHCAAVKLPTIFHSWAIAAPSGESVDLCLDATQAKTTMEIGVEIAPK